MDSSIAFKFALKMADLGVISQSLSKAVEGYKDYRDYKGCVSDYREKIAKVGVNDREKLKRPNFEKHMQIFIKNEIPSDQTVYELASNYLFIGEEFTNVFRKEFVEAVINDEKLVAKVFLNEDLARSAFEFYIQMNFLAKDLKTQKEQIETIKMILKNTSRFEISHVFIERITGAKELTGNATQEEIEKQNLYNEILKDTPENLMNYLSKSRDASRSLVIVSELGKLGLPSIVDEFVKRFCYLENFDTLMGYDNQLFDSKLKSYQKNKKINEDLLQNILSKRKDFEEKVINKPTPAIFSFNIERINKNYKLTNIQLKSISKFYQKYCNDIDPKELSSADSADSTPQSETHIKALESYRSFVNFCAKLDDKEMFNAGKANLSELDKKLPYPYNDWTLQLARACNTDTQQLVSQDEMDNLTQEIFQGLRKSDPSIAQQYADRSYEWGNHQIKDYAQTEFSKPDHQANKAEPKPLPIEGKKEES